MNAWWRCTCMWHVHSCLPAVATDKQSCKYLVDVYFCKSMMFSVSFISLYTLWTVAVGANSRLRTSSCTRRYKWLTIDPVGRISGHRGGTRLLLIKNETMRGEEPVVGKRPHVLSVTFTVWFNPRNPWQQQSKLLRSMAEKGLHA
uniref:Secreted protein n=1 Tax=Steinernema glaseri TaxID=37863 RepID=A0A1I7YY09_9BILA